MSRDIAALTPHVAAVMRHAAETAILPRFRDASLTAIDKGRGELVTIADRESEAMLAEGLSALLPEAAVLGEEACAADPAVMAHAAHALCWIIDPLDGTGNFAAGDERFGVLVALAAHGETVGGWILKPLTGRLCHAVKGGGAFVDGQPIAPRAVAAPPVLGLSALWGDEAARKATVERLSGHFAFAPLARCAAELYPQIALGGFDAALFGRTLAWDHAAGALLVEEAGGRARRADGSPYRADDDPDRRGLIVAADPTLWDDVRLAFDGVPA